MKNEMAIAFVGVLVEVVHAIGVKQRGPPLDAVDIVALLQQKLGQVSAVLSEC